MSPRKSDPDTVCSHKPFAHRVSSLGPGQEYEPDTALRSVLVCARRACVLDAMAWVERGDAGPAHIYSHGTKTVVPLESIGASA